MIWADQIVLKIFTICAVLILVVLLRRYLVKGKIEDRTLKRALIFLIIVSILQVIGQILLVYLRLRQSPLGIYLLPSKGSNYFYQTSWEIVWPWLASIVMALAIVLIGVIISRLFRRSWFEKTDILILFLTIFVVGYQNAIVLIFASFILMILYQIFEIIRLKGGLKEAIRLRIPAFFILVSIIILILANFSFYWQFLNYFELI